MIVQLFFDLQGNFPRKTNYRFFKKFETTEIKMRSFDLSAIY